MSVTPDRDLQELAIALGYEFKNISVLALALNHRSAKGSSNERLEFLGDAVLDSVISLELFNRFESADEGVLSRLRANLVRDKSLGALAAALNVGHVLRLGPGELKSGGARRNSILADALEAIFGAIFIDGGYAAIEQVILSVFKERLASLTLEDAGKDNKTRLQEHLQSRGNETPIYTLSQATGKPHKQTFLVSCKIASADIETSGEGSSRRRAEQKAALAALELLEQSVNV